MKQVLIIPNRKYLKEYLKLAREYGLGFEYNEFYVPDLLDDKETLKKHVEEYKAVDLPEYTSVHGAFYDVIPFSLDRRIREIAEERIEQSIGVAKDLGAQAVVFHTNYNPGLNSKRYVEKWVEVNAEFWSRVLEKHSDINIYLENMFEKTPKLLLALSEKLGKHANYGVCLDYAHASLSDTEPEIWAKDLGKYIKHVHINDNDGKSDLHLAWGRGVMDRAKFYDCYEKYLQGATVLVEIAQMEDILESLQVLRQEGFLQ